MSEAESEEEERKLHRADIQLLVSEEEVPPEQQEWSPSLNQEDPPEPPHIKEEQEELWSSQEGEQLRGLEEADITKFTFTPVTVKSEEDEEEPQSSQLHQRQTEGNRDAEHLETEAGGEDCGRSACSSEPETDCSCDLEETWVPESGLNSLQNNEVPVWNKECSHRNTSVTSSEFETSFGHSGHLQKQREIWSKIITEIKLVSCSFCGKRHHLKDSLTTRMRLHSEGKHFSCSVCRPIAENGEEPKLLDTVFNPEVWLHRADVQQLLVSKEEFPPEQQEWSPSLNQEDPPELPHIKEEQEELWSSQEGEQLRGLEEADIIKFTFTPVTVKSKDSEQKPESSKFHQSQSEENRDAEHLKTAADGEDCEGSEAAGNVYPDSNLQTAAHEETSDSSEPETDDSCDWEETREPQSGLNPLQNNEAPAGDKERNSKKTSVSSSECVLNGHKGHLQEHSGIRTGLKPFSCSVCGKSYHGKNSLRSHMRLHSGAKRYSCSLCNETFQWKRNVLTHMRIHTGEKPFSCSVCGLSFTQSSCLTSHLRVHTGEKPFTCSVCKACFSVKSNLTRHMRMHTGDKPFSCSVCGKGFAESGHMRQHLTVHTGEKPFSCSVCGKRFAQQGTLRRHLTIHTGEKPFSCSVCDKRFTRLHNLKKHRCFFKID